MQNAFATAAPCDFVDTSENVNNKNPNNNNNWEKPWVDHKQVLEIIIVNRIFCFTESRARCTGNTQKIYRQNPFAPTPRLGIIMPVKLAQTYYPAYVRVVTKFCYGCTAFWYIIFKIYSYTVLIIIQKPTCQCYMDALPAYCLKFTKTIKTYYYYY